MPQRKGRNDAVYRKEQFLGWAEEDLNQIEALALAASSEASASAASRTIRRLKKTSVLSLLETLARASEGGGKNNKKRGFASFVETISDWRDAKRVSVVHLSQALHHHLRHAAQESKLWEPLRSYLVSRHSWLYNGEGVEHSIIFDPLLEEIEEHWPAQRKCYRLSLHDFKHSYLLYQYRSCLVHESREPTFSMEHDKDTNAVYMTVDNIHGGREYHLVYPLPFLIALTRQCIAGMRRSIGCQDPYDQFQYGPYLISELNLPTPVHVIGGGLAGSEAAWQLARRGVPAVLHEMRPVRATAAHRGAGLAELVCSNSLRSDDAEANAVGLLHEEMRRAGSLILAAADQTRVPAGSALAVDREAFSARVEAALAAEPLVSIVREEVAGLPPPEWDSVILATGPLTSPALAEALRQLTGEDALAFFDAIAPVVYRDSIDFSKAWFQSRYDKGEGRDYINCPLSRDEYAAFIEALLAAEAMAFKEWEADTPYFEGCLPVEVMAGRGPETLAYGPMKPVGLTNPHAPCARPHAVVQLRQDNALGTLYNMVGFQTKLRHAEQVRVFRMIPGLERAEFARLGGLHRNTFVNSPRLLDATLRLKARPAIRLAGQITGCEGYVESAAVGLLAGRFAATERDEAEPLPPPQTTALGALLAHITGGAVAETFQPMNVNFGLFPPLASGASPGGKPLRGRARKHALSARALADLAGWL